MKFKTNNLGMYVRKMNPNEFTYTPTKLDRISKIAFSGKKEEHTYQVIFFVENEPNFTKFDKSIKYLASTMNVNGELLSIIDNRTEGFSSFFNREVQIDGNSFKVFDSEIPYEGRIYNPKVSEDIIMVTFTNLTTNEKESNLFRFVPTSNQYSNEWIN